MRLEQAFGDEAHAAGEQPRVLQGHLWGTAALLHHNVRQRRRRPAPRGEHRGGPPVARSADLHRQPHLAAQPAAQRGLVAAAGFADEDERREDSGAAGRDGRRDQRIVGPVAGQVGEDELVDARPIGQPPRERRGVGTAPAALAGRGQEERDQEDQAATPQGEPPPGRESSPGYSVQTGPGLPGRGR
jgi:hypothetical protein